MSLFADAVIGGPPVQQEAAAAQGGVRRAVAARNRAGLRNRLAQRQNEEEANDGSNTVFIRVLVAFSHSIFLLSTCCTRRFR